MEVADFPRIGKQLVRVGMKATVYDVKGAQKLSFDEE